MKVLFLGTLDGISGGVAHYMQNIINHDNSENDKLQYVVGCLISESDKELYKKDTKFINFDMRYGIYKVQKKLNEIHKIVVSNSIDLIHVHTQRAGLIAAIYKKVYGIKVVYTPHGLRHSQLKGLGSFIHKMIEKFILNNIDVITTLSDSELDLVKQVNDKVYVKKINTRINTIEFEKNRLDNKKVIAMIGSCDDRKQPYLFINIAKRYIKKDIKFIWIGNGPLYDEVKDFIKQENLINIKFLGQKNDLEAKELIKNSDILLFTSKQEGIPLTILEAMMLKVPIISNNFFGIEDVITDKKNGLIFKNSNIDEAKSFIDLLLRNNEINNRLVLNAYRSYNEKHSNIDKFSNEFVGLYEEIM
jgi:glycosyltransferase involved in cell wall biosynthesis